MQNLNNWIYEGKEVRSIEDLPSGTHTFIYIIENLDKNKIYIGRKQVIAVRNKPITERERKLPEFADRRKKKRQIITEARKWMEYTGSNKELNEDIGNGDTIRKTILKCCKTKNQATYYETKMQFCEGIIEGEVNSYNDNILGKFYRKSLDDEYSQIKL